MFSSCDALPYHWNTTSMAERVGLPPCNGSPTLNIITHRFSVPPISPSGQTALAHTYTICVICARGRVSPSSTVRQRTPPLGSLYPSDKCELPVPRLRTALQVQDRPAEPLPYPQIRGTDNVILETEGPPR